MENARVDSGGEMLLIVRGFVEALADLTAQVIGEGRRLFGGITGRDRRLGGLSRETFKDSPQAHERVRKMGRPILPA